MLLWWPPDGALAFFAVAAVRCAVVVRFCFVL